MKHRRFTLLSAWGVALLADFLAPGASGQTAITNPYYASPAWKLWVTDPAPVTSAWLIAPGQVGTMAPTASRLYPDDADTATYPGRFLAYRTTDWPERQYAGFWDDVYFSLDSNGTTPATPHSWISSSWSGTAGNSVVVEGKFMTGFTGYTGWDPGVKTFGITFTSQSTTSMGHDIANSASSSGNYCIPVIERDWYFANCLRAGPAHISFQENNYYQMDDSYQALAPCYYNSIGSSGTETKALTKMMIAGGYLPTAMKNELKRNGLYMATLLYIWKAALPYDVPYDNELRHRVAYTSDGGNLVATALNRPFHLYDDTAHMAAMVALAKTMTNAPPIALLKKVELVSGTETYSTKTTLLLQQAANQSVVVRVSTEDSFDLQGRPLTFRWKLLYGNANTTVQQEGETSTYQITVPADPNLPQGRTTLLLVANNGIYDSNPAVVNVYRAVGATNRRPTLTGLDDVTIRPGETVDWTIAASDPDGFPVTLYRRSGEAGTLSGTNFTWATATNTPNGIYPVALLASDGTGGYNSREARITVTSTVARISATPADGTAPLTVAFSSADSADTGSNGLSVLWTFDDGTSTTTPNPTHTFTTPGLYRCNLTVSGPLGTDTRQVVIEARNAWSLRITNGWSGALDPAVWTVTNAANGSVTVSGGKVILTASARLAVGIESVATFQPPLYLEAEFSKSWAGSGALEGFHLLGSLLGWTGVSSPFRIRNLATGAQADIGAYLSSPTVERATLRVYVTADPLNPGKMRYTGKLEGLLGSSSFCVDNQSPAPDTLKVLCGFSELDLYRYQVWSPDASNTPPVVPEAVYNTVPYAESFENLAGWGGAYGSVFGHRGWYSDSPSTDRSAITNLAYAFDAASLPLRYASHTNVVQLDTQGATLTNSLGPGFDMSGATTHIDLMLRFVPAAAVPAPCTPQDTGAKFVVYANASSNLVVYHGVAAADGTLLSNTVDVTALRLDPTNWYRLTVALDATVAGTANLALFQVRINGVPVTNAAAYPDSWKALYLATGQLPAPASDGSWFRAATTNANTRKLMSIEFKGTGFLDDLRATTLDPFDRWSGSLWLLR